MKLQDKLEYAQLRANGAALFGRDKQEATQWYKAAKELEAEIKEQGKLICPKCNALLIGCDDYRMTFSGSELSESGNEYLYCQKCEIRYDYSLIVEDFGFVKEE